MHNSNIAICYFDLNMFQVDGLGLIESVRSGPELSETILLFITSENDPANVSEAVKYNIGDVSVHFKSPDGAVPELATIKAEGFGLDFYSIDMALDAIYYETLALIFGMSLISATLSRSSSFNSKFRAYDQAVAKNFLVSVGTSL